MVEDVPPEELKAWLSLVRYFEQDEFYKDEFKELSKMAAQYLTKNKPMPPSLHQWLISVFEEMGEGESPDKAFGYKSSKRKENATHKRKRDMDIFLEVRDLMEGDFRRKSIDKNKAITQVSEKYHKSPETIVNIYERIRTHIIKAEKSRPRH